MQPTLTSMKYELGDLRERSRVSRPPSEGPARRARDALHKALELVGLGGLLSGRVEEVNSERLRAKKWGQYDDPGEQLT